ncbi:MAG: HAD family phosphatase [Chlorobi bacterium]|nr:HAD family phosphatase [Chlorobiota bacterium]
MNDLLNFESYLFDMDGTLVASEKLKGEALVKTCIAAGGSANLSDYKPVMGESWETVRNHFYEVSKIDIPHEEFDEIFRSMYKDLISSKVELTKGTNKLLTLLKKNNKKIGVVTSATRWMADEILNNINLSKIFDVLITKENVTKHKPDPEAYLLALEKLNTSAENTLIFEDSSVGIVAGNRAGCKVIGLKHDLNSLHDFSGASMTIRDFDELL